VDDRGRRIRQNEVVFREVNERLRDLGESFSLVGELAEFVCECGDSGCTDRVQMPISDYERIRSNPKWFLVVKGHEELDYEVVIEQKNGYVVVEKLPGGPAEIAINDDPRGPQQ
jgi:hypothetical protein